jgi:type VI secretion system secreted protein Hcp
MPVDAFLQFVKTGASGIVLNGETKDDYFSKKKPVPFEIQDWKFAVSNPVNIGSSSGGGGAGKVQFETFTVKKNIDTSSSHIFWTCCAGGHFEDVSLLVRRAGGTRSASGQVYLQFDFKLVAVENIAWSNGDVPSEDITFRFGALQFTYTPQNQDGSSGTPIVTSWDQILNTDDFKGGFS